MVTQSMFVSNKLSSFWMAWIEIHFLLMNFLHGMK